MGKGRTFELEESFEHEGGTCVIVSSTPGNKLEVAFKKVINDRSVFTGKFHNGYVQTLDKNKGEGYDQFNHNTPNRITTVELTYAGPLDYYGFPEDMWFLGFDTDHLYNVENPHTQTLGSVKDKTKELCEEMVEKEI